MPLSSSDARPLALPLVFLKFVNSLCKLSSLIPS
nr:MAG TPA: hypothetical protein [Caudoviricetes sp.]